jgi:hypothetical protein
MEDKMIQYNTTEHFECECSSDEHTLKFTLDELTGDIADLEIWTSVFLNQGGFWQRLRTAIKYLFGYKCKYGHFDCFIMRPVDVNRMMNLLQKYKELQSKLEAKRAQEEICNRVCDNVPEGDDIGKYPQNCGPFVNAIENFE